MKVCIEYHRRKNIFEFNKTKSGTSTYCTVCSAKPRVRFTTKKTIKKSIKKLKKKKMIMKKRKLKNVKLGSNRTKGGYSIAAYRITSNTKSFNKCMICGEDDIICLLFHHVDNNNKTKGISTLCRKGTILTLVEEIRKCIVVCANCHYRIHLGGLEYDKSMRCIVITSA